MTIPFTPSGEETSPAVTAFEGLISGAAFSALTNRTETSVRAAIQADIIANDTWGTLWDVFLGFIRLPLDWIVDILKKLFPWINWAGIPEDFNDILTWINNALTAIPFFGTFIQGAETFIQALLRNVIEFFTNPGTGLLNALKALFGTAGGLINTVISSIVYWLSNPGALLTGLTDALKTLFGNAGALIGTVIDSLIYFITHPGQPGGIGYLLLEAFKTLFANAGGLIGTVINSIVYWLTNPGDLLTGIISAAKTWISNGGELFATLLATVTGWITGGFQTIEAFFGSLWGGTSSLLKGLMENIITSILGPNAVLEWNSLTNWASGLLNVGNILQAIKDALFNLTHLFPVIDTTATEVNLILQGSFKTASTLSAASGWAWDSTTNNTAGGSVGGAGVGGTAKVTAAGAARYLYCNQQIQVVAGDSLTFSAWVKTGSLTRSGSTTPLSLLIFPGSATSGTAVTATAAWPLAPTTFTKISGTYTVPDGVTTVRVGIGITAAALTGSVWFDDVFLGATRTLKQPLVRDLTKAFGGVKDALNRHARGTTPTTTLDYDSFFDAASTTAGLASTAYDNAGTAQDGVNETWNAAYDGYYDPSTPSTGKTATDFKGIHRGHKLGTETAQTAATDANTLAEGSLAAGSNLCSNPEFENIKLSTDSAGRGGITSATVGVPVGAPGGIVRTGTYAAYGNALTGSTTSVFFTTNTTGRYKVPCIPYDWYYLEVYVCGKATNSATSGTVSLVVDPYNKDGSAMQSVTAVSITPNAALNGAANWTKISGYALMPETVTHMSAGVRISGVATGNTFYFDNPVIREVTDAKEAGTLTSNLQTSIVNGYTVYPPISSTQTFTIPANLSEFYVILFGAGSNGSTPFNAGSPGGLGGVAGDVIATQLDSKTLPAAGTDVTCTVGSSSSPVTSFGTIVSTSNAYKSYVSTPLGLQPTVNAPAGGGNGGFYSGTPSNGSAGVATASGLAGGDGGTAFNGVTAGTALAGKAGGSGVTFGLTRTGGSGGGGGGGAATTGGSVVVTGGKGGAGGFPGGGGGGGGAARASLSSSTAVFGAGGVGGGGMIQIIYKLATTT